MTEHYTSDPEWGCGMMILVAAAIIVVLVVALLIWLVAR